jgi:hypothetical protein
LNIVKKVRLYRKFRENTELMQQLYFMSNSLYL